MMSLLFAGALLLAAASAERTTTWRIAVAGPGCEALFAADDFVPVNATHGDLFVAHDHKNRTDARLAEQHGCTVLDRQQGRPGREFLVPDGYIPPEEMMRLFELLALTHPERSRLIDLTEEFGTPPTAGGSHIYALKVSDNAGEDEDEPNVLLVGMHHAREIMGPETVLLIARYLLEGGREDPRVRQLLAGTQVYLAWDWNPDGWNYVFDVDNNWRKNRLPNSDGSFGVDLNRNYPFGWE
jgi:murein tripeptide amidase MpaA